MGKRRIKSRTQRPIQNYENRKTTNQAVGILKKLQRRLAKGMQIPFMVVSVDPRPDQDGQLRAFPSIASLRMEDPEQKWLVQATLDHLVQIGALKTSPTDQSICDSLLEPRTSEPPAEMPTLENNLEDPPED